jgi:hypothetical protein
VKEINPTSSAEGLEDSVAPLAALLVLTVDHFNRNIIETEGSHDVPNRDCSAGAIED